MQRKKGESWPPPLTGQHPPPHAGRAWGTALPLPVSGLAHAGWQERLDVQGGLLRELSETATGQALERKDPDQVGGREAKPPRLVFLGFPVGQAAGHPWGEGWGPGCF